MTFVGWLQIVVYALVIFALTKPLGIYMFRVFEGERRPLERVFGPLERGLYAACGVDPRREQTWLQYTFALLAFSTFEPARQLRDLPPPGGAAARTRRACPRSPSTCRGTRR